MKKTIAFLSVFMLLNACSKNQDNDEKSKEAGVTVWDNTGWSGHDTSFAQTTNYIGNDWNDRISSVKVKDGFTVTFYNDANFGTNLVTLKGPAEYNCNAETNDIFSSLKIEENN